MTARKKTNRKPKSSRARNRRLARKQANALNFETLEPRHLLASLTVDTLSDVAADGFTLREAIVQANSTPDADSISFSPSLFASGSGSISLTAALPTISTPLTIEGPSARLLTIDAGRGGDNEFDGDGFRVFEINDGQGLNQVDVSISGLTLTGGDITDENPVDGTGGALINFENLTLDRVSIEGNGARFGGGIGNERVGTLTLTNSTIANNESNQNGGGISTDGVFTGTNVTISGNNATGSGGAIVTAGRNATGATLTLNSSTVTDNTDGDSNGLLFFGGYGPTTATFNNTIIDSDILGVGDNTPFGPITLSGDNNLFSGADPGFTGGAANLFSQSAMLGPLADNGGPTQTHALLAGSPAIDAGDNDLAVDAEGNPLATDQRGGASTRIFDDPTALGSGVDIGAFELHAVLVDTQADEVVADDNLSLREAIVLVNGDAELDTITFDVSLSGGTINIASQLPTITDTLTIDASLLVDNVIIDAGDGADGAFGTGDGYRIFRIDDGDAGNLIDVTLNGLTLTGGDTANGVDRVDEDNVFVDATAGADGGAILSIENLTLIDSLVTENATGAGGRGDNTRLGGAGGGIHARFGDVTLTNSAISGNFTGAGGDGGSGGGIYARFGDVTLTNSAISGNSTGAGDESAGGDGGGIYARFGDVTLTNSAISGNSTGGWRAWRRRRRRWRRHFRTERHGDTYQ